MVFIAITIISIIIIVIVLVCRAGVVQRHVPLAGDDHGAERQPLLGRRVPGDHPLPAGLPVQAPQGGLQDQGVPPQHQQQRQHLPRHPQGPVEPRPHHFQGKDNQLIIYHIYLSATTTTMTIVMVVMMVLAHGYAGSAVDMLAADGPQPGRPAGAGDRAHVQGRPDQVRVHGQGLDAQVRHGMR
uniref:Uncharacterized protein n=1 Tax=Triticum urartu TaxID=4572 RepID=A0A8R7UPR7_TRIUA